MTRSEIRWEFRAIIGDSGEAYVRMSDVLALVDKYRLDALEQGDWPNSATQQVLKNLASHLEDSRREAQRRLVVQ